MREERHNERKETICQVSMQAAFIMLVDGEVFDLNEVTVQFMRKAKEEMVGQHFSSLVHSSARSVIMQRYAQRLKGCGPRTPYTWLAHLWDGRLILVDTEVSPINMKGHRALAVALRNPLGAPAVDAPTRFAMQLMRLDAMPTFSTDPVVLPTLSIMAVPSLMEMPNSRRQLWVWMEKDTARNVKPLGSYRLPRLVFL